MQIEVYHVPAELPQPADSAAADRRTRFVGKYQFGGDAQQTIRARLGLAHEDIALFRLEPRSPRRFPPADIHIAGCHPRAARSTSAGRTFERKIDALP